MQNTARNHQHIIDIKLTKLDKATTLLIVNLGIIAVVARYLFTYSQASLMIKQSAIAIVLAVILGKFVLSLLMIHLKANQLRKQTNIQIPSLKQAYAMLIKETDVQTIERLRRTAKTRRQF